MLGAQTAVAPAPSSQASRLIAEPRRAVGLSVLPDDDPERAAAQATDSGITAALLDRFGATIRQTHRRANVVVIDVPADRQAALAEALRAVGIPARPPVAITALLTDSVPLLRVPALLGAQPQRRGRADRDRRHGDRCDPPGSGRPHRGEHGLQRHRHAR